MVQGNMSRRPYYPWLCAWSGKDNRKFRRIERHRDKQHWRLDIRRGAVLY
jgi:hypothetical protein